MYYLHQNLDNTLGLATYTGVKGSISFYVGAIRVASGPHNIVILIPEPNAVLKDVFFFIETGRIAKEAR